MSPSILSQEYNFNQKPQSLVFVLLESPRRTQRAMTVPMWVSFCLVTCGSHVSQSCGVGKNSDILFILFLRYEGLFINPTGGGDRCHMTLMRPGLGKKSPLKWNIPLQWKFNCKSQTTKLKYQSSNLSGVVVCKTDFLYILIRPLINCIIRVEIEGGGLWSQKMTHNKGSEKEWRNLWTSKRY